MSHKSLSRGYKMRVDLERICEFQVIYNREKLRSLRDVEHCCNCFPMFQCYWTTTFLSSPQFQLINQRRSQYHNFSSSPPISGSPSSMHRRGRGLHEFQTPSRSLQHKSRSECTSDSWRRGLLYARGHRRRPVARGLSRCKPTDGLSLDGRKNLGQVRRRRVRRPALPTVHSPYVPHTKPRR